MKSKLFTMVFISVLIFSKLLFAEAPQSLSTILKPFVDKHELAGAVALVADKSKVLSVESVGFADIGAEKAMKADSVFWIASQSKPMTAVAVMILVDEGKISLDDPIEKYVVKCLLLRKITSTLFYGSRNIQLQFVKHSIIQVVCHLNLQLKSLL